MTAAEAKARYLEIEQELARLDERYARATRSRNFHFETPSGRAYDRRYWARAAELRAEQKELIALLPYNEEN